MAAETRQFGSGIFLFLNPGKLSKPARFFEAIATGLTLFPSAPMVRLWSVEVRIALFVFGMLIPAKLFEFSKNTAQVSALLHSALMAKP